MFRRPLPAIRQRDADAGGDEHLTLCQRDRAGDLVEDPLSHSHGDRGLSDVSTEDGELVAAESSHGIARPEGPAQPLTNGHQQLVASVVSQAVIDHLEVIQVQEQNGDPAALGFGSPLDQTEPMQERAPVRKPCEWIVHRLMREPLIDGLAFSDVLDMTDRIPCLAVRALHS